MNQLHIITALPSLPPRPRDAHKGTFGTVIIVGGCDTMMGAPALSATAALRSGAGLVKIATVPAALPVALTIEPSATGIMLSDDIATTLHQLDGADPQKKAILAVGPGLGQSDDARELVEALLQGSRTIVLDADGLNLLARLLHKTNRLQIKAPLVLTPHPGEFSRLADALSIHHSPTDSASRPAAAAALANALHATVLLKGASTIISDGQRYFINTTGNPALATAGSGDVLTGLLAALIAQGAQGTSPFDAACLAAHLHGLAADLWANVHGQSGLLARELATLLPDAFNHCRHGNHD